MQAVVQFEMAESFLGRRGDTGISCSLTWNNIIGRTETDDGNEVLFHAGPGIMAGYCKDFRFRNEPAPYGIAFGLQGKAGVTIIYDRNISISICVAPVIGFHLTRTGEELNMNYYKYGLLRVLMPEIGIKYRF